MTDQPIATAPGSLPLIDHALVLARNPLEFLESQRTLGPLVRINLGAMPAHLVNDPALVHEILVRDAGSTTMWLAAESGSNFAP